MINQVFCDFSASGKVLMIQNLLNTMFDEVAYPIYILKKPLGLNDDVHYNYTGAIVILLPKHKIIFINVDGDEIAFQEYKEDFLEDISHLSDRYLYKRVLGRPREWSRLIFSIALESIDIKHFDTFLESLIVNEEETRKIELLISLLVGSINDVTNIDTALPQTILDMVKQKIILFDGNQSRFIYANSEHEKPIVRIQGLAGTGKTELLLHRLKRIYILERQSKIAFTCYNHVLAEELKSRIPKFFNYMKVDEQIEWKSRLFVFPSWGSKSTPTSGIYSFICSKYGLKFYPFSLVNSFAEACKRAVEELNSRSEPFEKCFTYTFIDESQDFPEIFIDLCSMVTEKQVFVAGDIFQNIFDMNIKNQVQCDYLLNKCYRTDPRTLMFAHSVGMGLFEKPIIRWLSDEEWAACGYKLTYENKERVRFERNPVRRFNDNVCIDKSIELSLFSIDDINASICKCIDSIIADNSTIQAEDIGVIFTYAGKMIYDIIDNLEILIGMKYNWNVCKGYIIKEREQGKLYISNTNNIKGLEFPYVICVTAWKITRDIINRNTLYMALTRSFIKSYFLLEKTNETFNTIYEKAAKDINMSYNMILSVPGKTEIEQQERVVSISAVARKSVEQIIHEVCAQYPSISPAQVESIINFIPNIINDNTEEEVFSKTEKLAKTILGNE